jgi:hypothetical protein
VALIASVVKQGSGASTAIDTSNAKLLIVLDGGFTATVPADSKSNTFTTLTHTATGSIRPDLFMGYKINPTVGTGHTVSTTNGNDTIIMLAFDDNVSAVDVTTIGDQTYAGHTTTSTTGSITTTQNGDLLVAVFTIDDPPGAPYTYTAGFTAGPFGEDNPGNFFGASVAYGIQSTAGAITCTRTRSVAATQPGESLALLSFKVTAAASSVVFRRTLSALGTRTGSRQVHNRWKRSDRGGLLLRDPLILPEAA